jgi:hypothetical protein
MAVAALTGLRRLVEPGSKGSKELRVLNLEESSLDTEPLRANMAEGGIDCEMIRVETRADVAALKDGNFDLNLAGYAVPSLDGLSALELAREKFAPRCRLSSWSPRGSARKCRSKA